MRIDCVGRDDAGLLRIIILEELTCSSGVRLPEVVIHVVVSCLIHILELVKLQDQHAS